MAKGWDDRMLYELFTDETKQKFEEKPMKDAKILGYSVAEIKQLQHKLAQSKVFINDLIESEQDAIRQLVSAREEIEILKEMVRALAGVLKDGKTIGWIMSSASKYGLTEWSKELGWVFTDLGRDALSFAAET